MALLLAGGRGTETTVPTMVSLAHHMNSSFFTLHFSLNNAPSNLDWQKPTKQTSVGRWPLCPVLQHPVHYITFDVNAGCGRTGRGGPRPTFKAYYY